jgi:hypothetical protein
MSPQSVARITRANVAEGHAGPHRRLSASHSRSSAGVPAIDLLNSDSAAALRLPRFPDHRIGRPKLKSAAFHQASAPAESSATNADARLMIASSAGKTPVEIRWQIATQ